jgi:hypothetical protein
MGSSFTVSSFQFMRGKRTTSGIIADVTTPVNATKEQIKMETLQKDILILGTCQTA